MRVYGAPGVHLRGAIAYLHVWMRPLVVVTLMLLAYALAPTPTRVGKPAPEITGERWINSAELSLSALRGRVCSSSSGPTSESSEAVGRTVLAHDVAGGPAGIVRYRHIGEGAYDETEAMIQALLKADRQGER